MSEAVNERSGVLMSIRGVTKAFGSNVVLKGINMDVKKGEVIALIGGNGAGKSTLMKIIMGIYDLDEGEIFMAGQPVKLGKPSASLAQGIYLVPQEPMLFPNMTVLENVLMGFHENEAELKKRLQKHMEELGFTLNLQRKASTLSIAEQQLVEILRGMMREALQNMTNVRVYTKEGASLLSFNVEGMASQVVAAALDEQNIAVRGGLHCAPGVHRFLGTLNIGAVRVSPGLMNTAAEAKKLIDAVWRIAKG